LLCIERAILSDVHAPQAAAAAAAAAGGIFTNEIACWHLSGAKHRCDTDSTETTDCLPALLSIRFLLLFSFLCLHFLVFGTVPQIKLTYVSF